MSSVASAEEPDLRFAVAAGIAAPFVNQYTIVSPALAVSVRQPLHPQLELTASMHVTRAQVPGAQRWSQHLLLGPRLRPIERIGLFAELGLGVALAREQLELTLENQMRRSGETTVTGVAGLTLGWEVANRYFAQATLRPYMPGSAQFVDLALLVGVSL